MVDCGNLRCFQERRSIRKELLSWSKKVPVAVALETIAEHVGSRRKVRKLLEPFRCLESKEPVDWVPEEDCIYCPEKTQVVNDEQEKSENKGKEDGKDVENLGSVAPKISPDSSSREVLRDIKTGHNEPNVAPANQEPLPPKCGQDLRVSSEGPQNAENDITDLTNKNNKRKGCRDDESPSLFSDMKSRSFGMQQASAISGIPGSNPKTKVQKLDGDESSCGSHYGDEEVSSNESLGHPYGEMPFPSSRERALQLSDLLQLSQMQCLAPYSMPFLMKPEILSTLDSLELEKKLQQIRHKHNLGKASNNHYKEKARKYPLRPFQQELIKKLMKERLELERRSTESLKLDSYMDMRSFTHSVILSALEGNSSRAGQQHMKTFDPSMDLYSNALNHSALLSALTMNPLAPSQAREMEPQVTSHSSIVVPAYSPAKSSSSSTLSSSSSSGSNSGSPKKLHNSSPSLSGDMKTSPSQALFKYENTRIGDTLKDIIVKTISEKVKCKLESTDFSGLVGGASSFGGQKAKETLMSAFSIPDALSPPPVKRIKRKHMDTSLTIDNRPSSVSDSTGSSSNANSGQQTKKTRPKRGQYRKYNSQLLTEAVKAVQRGEMSVHRAGSYYGVPHSTLEYKVKERHLLRQKKIKEQQERKMKEAEEAKKNEEQNNSPSKPSNLEKMKSNSSKLAAELLNISAAPKAFQGPSWLPPFAGPSPFDSAAALGLFGTGFSLNTPASELLRKLQHKVQILTSPKQPYELSGQRSVEKPGIYLA